MNRQVRRPGPVNEETVPFSPEISGVEVTEVHLESSDRTIKSQRASSGKKPKPVHEATEPASPETPFLPEGIPEPAKGSHWTRLFMVFILFIASWLLYATVISLMDAWRSSVSLAIPLTLITVIFIIFLGALVRREWQAIQSIDRIHETRLQLGQYIHEDSIVGVRQTLKPVLACIQIHYPEEYRQFDEAWQDRRTVQEYLLLLDNLVLSRLDKDVNDAINKASLSVAGLVAISPHPTLDAVIVIIRANMLIRKIGRIYGLEPTGLSSLYLFKYTIVSAIAAAGIEEIGVGLTENVTKFVAEGIVSAGRMYRLGKLTKKITRPLPQSF